MINKKMKITWKVFCFDDFLTGKVNQYLQKRKIDRVIILMMGMKTVFNQTMA